MEEIKDSEKKRDMYREMQRGALRQREIS